VVHHRPFQLDAVRPDQRTVGEDPESPVESLPIGVGEHDDPAERGLVLFPCRHAVSFARHEAIMTRLKQENAAST